MDAMLAPWILLSGLPSFHNALFEKECVFLSGIYDRKSRIALQLASCNPIRFLRKMWLIDMFWNSSSASEKKVWVCTATRVMLNGFRASHIKNTKVDSIHPLLPIASNGEYLSTTWRHHDTLRDSATPNTSLRFCLYNSCCSSFV